MERQHEQDLTGKVVIVTGASRGVGRQAGILFAARGARVVLAARTVEPDEALPGTLGEALQQIEPSGGEALAVATDLASEADLHRLVDATVDRFGGVDVLVNNAAATNRPIWSTRFLDLSREDWLYQFDVNVHAPFTLIQRCVPIMEARVPRAARIHRAAVLGGAGDGGYGDGSGVGSVMCKALRARIRHPELVSGSSKPRWCGPPA
jgi:NAD(P)-dependent dehydrogenase (short-subunit alcohol dehydrogenase family)